MAALEDELRRGMYEYIRAQGRPVSREEAGSAVGISAKLAAFHLDKLVDHGLLKAHYGRLPGRGGRGAGRSSKLYEPGDVDVEVSIPERRYDLIGEILVAALARATQGEPAADAARRAAADKGREVGAEVRRRMALRPPGAVRTLAVVEQVLAQFGFEPYRDSHDGIRLRNCPFHHLSRSAPELVCGLNQAFVDGLLRGLGNDSVEAELHPRPGECCVQLTAP